MSAVLVSSLSDSSKGSQCVVYLRHTSDASIRGRGTTAQYEGTGPVRPSSRVVRGPTASPGPSSGKGRGGGPRGHTTLEAEEWYWSGVGT